MSDFNCKHPDLIVQRNYGHRWVTCTECNTDFLPADDAARRFASLTSPETITEIAKMLNDWYPPSKHPLMDAVKYQSQAKSIVEAVLRSVEEGKT